MPSKTPSTPTPSKTPIFTLFFCKAIFVMILCTFLAFNFQMCRCTKNEKYQVVEVLGPSGPQLLVGGPSGRLDFVLRALRALGPCDSHNDVVSVRTLTMRYFSTDGCTNGGTDKAFLGVGCTKNTFFSHFTN